MVNIHTKYQRIDRLLIIIFFLFFFGTVQPSYGTQLEISVIGITNNLPLDFKVQLDLWNDDGGYETETRFIKNDDRNEHGHVNFLIDINDKVKIVGISGVAIKPGEEAGNSTSVIPYKIFNLLTGTESSKRVTARLRRNVNLVGYFYGRKAFLVAENKVMGIHFFNRSLERALEMNVLTDDDSEFDKWNRIYGDFSALGNVILNEYGIDVRDPFLRGAKTVLGEINPVVRMKLYLNFVTSIHKEKMNSKGPDGAGSIDEWAKSEIENIITEHFLSVSDRARDYLTSLETRDDLDRCIEFSENVLTVANSMGDLETKIKPKFGATKHVDTLRSIMQKVTECVLGSYKNSTFDTTNNVRKASAHLVNKNKGQPLMRSFTSLYRRLREQGWVSNSNERDVEIHKFYNEFSAVLEEQ